MLQRALQQIAACARLQRREHVRLIAEDADDEDVAVRMPAGRETRHIETGDVGQPEIDEQDIGRERFEPR